MNFKDLWITLLILYAIEEKQFMLWTSSGHELHWLPVWIPADYKIIRLFFHFLYYIASAYLSELIMPYYLRWSLCVTFLFVPCIRQKKFGRHFPFSSSTIWNFSPFFFEHCLHLRLSCLASKFTFLRNIFHKQANSNALCVLRLQPYISFMYAMMSSIYCRLCFFVICWSSAKL